MYLYTNHDGYLLYLPPPKLKIMYFKKHLRLIRRRGEPDFETLKDMDELLLNGSKLWYMVGVDDFEKEYYMRYFIFYI